MRENRYEYELICHFKISKLIYKRENYIKKYKTHFLQFLLELGKDLIKKCGFNLKLHMPNKELYQGEAGERENKEFISKRESLFNFSIF